MDPEDQNLAKSEETNKCAVCNKDFKQVLKHLARSISCKRKYPFKELQYSIIYKGNF